MSTLTILIRTKGRPTLQEAVDSAQGADRIVVLSDGAEISRLAGCELVEYPKRGNFGFPMLHDFLPLVSTTHVTVLDDDDYYYPGAIERIRAELDNDVVLFPVWQVPRGEDNTVMRLGTAEIKYGNVCFIGFVWNTSINSVVPRGLARGQDWLFMRGIMSRATSIMNCHGQEPIAYARSLP